YMEVSRKNLRSVLSFVDGPTAVPIVLLEVDGQHSARLTEDGMAPPALLYEKRDGIAYITINRPDKRNSFSPEVLCRMADAWQDYAADDSLRVAIITGAG